MHETQMLAVAEARHSALFLIQRESEIDRRVNELVDKKLKPFT